MLIGLIIGALARLVMPGKQSIGVIMTTVLGAAGSLIGTWLSYKLGSATKAAASMSFRSWSASSSPSY